MKDRFDLENEIVSTSNYSTQMKDLADWIMENGSDDVDKIVNVLIGLSESLDIHTDKMYNTLCDAFYLNDVNEELKKNSGLPLTNADTSCMMKKCKGDCHHSPMSSFDYQ